MWKYLATLLIVLLSMGGMVAAQPVEAQPNECTDCYSNIVTQSDTQNIDTVALAFQDPFELVDSVAVGNEGLSAGIIVTKPPVNPTTPGQLFVTAPFARIDQKMDQTVSHLGGLDPDGFGDGAKGITWNKAIQAAWVANQGVKELENTTSGLEYVKEGSWISQNTTQLTNNVYDYDSREGAKVLNVDNKLAMIVDSVNAVLNLTANANSATTDTQTSNGTITNAVEVTIAGYDPEKL